MDDSFLAGTSFPESVPPSSCAALERWYRGLVTCYPRSLRREGTEEIVAVLLATARAGQRRPSLAETAKLLRGAFRMRTAMPRAPRSVRSAVRLMCLGAGAQLAVLIVTLAAIGGMRTYARSAALRQGPAAVANALALVNFHLAVDLLVLPCLIAGWLGVAWASARGHDWSRAVAVLGFLFYTGGVIITVTQGRVTYAPAAIIASAAVLAIGLAAIAALVARQSWPYYAQRPATAL